MSDRIYNKVLETLCAMQKAQLALLGGIAESLANQQKIESVLEELLLDCLKAAGIEQGVLYLFDINGKVLSQQVLGSKKIDGKKLEMHLGRSPVLNEVFTHKKNIQLPSTYFPEHITQEFLKKGVLTAAVLVPVVSKTECLGALLLGSRVATNITPDALSFVLTLGSQIGQAIALENAFNAAVSSAQRYLQIMDNASCGFIVLNHQGVILETNKYIEKLLNCTKEYLLKKDFREFVMPSMRAVVTAQFQKLIQLGSLDTNQIKLQPVNKQVRTIYYSSVEIPQIKIGNESLLLVTVTDITEFEKLKTEVIERKIENEIQLKKLMQTDMLTDINNRFTFLESLGATLEDAKKNNAVFAIAHIDIDHFAEINNVFGRDAGDYILKRLANFIKAEVNDLKNIARLSDNTFAIIFTKVTKLSDIEKFLKQFIAKIKKPAVFREKEIYITVGIGICVFPQDGDTSEKLLNHVNLALKHTKKMGGNNYQFYDAKMDVAPLMQSELESDLHRVIENKQFEVYYQPAISVDTQHITGAEALLRWRHPKFGLLMPDQFIPLAESTGLIIPIGEWVLNMACLQVKQWHDWGYRDLRIAVNLSTRQLNDPDLLKMIMRVVKSSHIPPASLILEITESILMQDIVKNSALLRALSDTGITLASDDFGTGYSSLNYLRKLPFNILKIDKSFIYEMENIQQKEAIVATIISLANDLDLQVIAEGVETRAQLDILKKYHCDFMQGFLFSKPITADAFIQLLQNDSKK